MLTLTEIAQTGLVGEQTILPYSKQLPQSMKQELHSMKQALHSTLCDLALQIPKRKYPVFHLQSKNQYARRSVQYEM
jgi:hypothetical protein